MTRETIVAVVRELRQQGHLQEREGVSGENWVFSCPITKNHGGRLRQNTPSFSIHMGTGKWGCFSCHWGSTSVYDLYARLMGMTTAEAQATVGTMDIPLDDLEAAVNSLGEEDEKIPSPMAPWPETRNIYPGDLADNYLKERKIAQHVWEKAGLEVFSSSARFQTFAGPSSHGGPRLIMPIYYEGQRVGFSARALLPDQVAKYYRPVNNVNSCIYNPGNIQPDTHPTVFVEEGEFDTLRSLTEEVPAVATFNAWVSVKQAAFLAQFEQVIFLYDPDPAGDAGAIKGLEKYGGFFEKARRFNMPPGMDPGDMPDGFGKRLLAMANRKPADTQITDLENSIKDL